MAFGKMPLLVTLAIFAAVMPASQAQPLLGQGGKPPWWILNGVRPAGPKKDMGAYSRLSFSEGQQRSFGVSESGAIVDADRFGSALKALRQGELQPNAFFEALREGELPFADVGERPKIALLRQLADPTSNPEEDVAWIEVPKGYTDPILV